MYPLNLKILGQYKFTSNFNLLHWQFREDSKVDSRLGFSVTGTHQLPFHINLMSNLGYQLPRTSLYSKSASRVYCNLNFTRPIIKQKLTATLLFNDLFSMLGRQRTDYFYTGYSQIESNTYSSFSVVARINYTLTWGSKSARVLRNNSGNAEEKGRIGGD